jgi:glycyl-tRNA synthetase (class II)
MRIILTIVLFLGLVYGVSAEPIKVTITNADTNDVLGEVTIAEEEVKAVEYYVYDFTDWIIEAVSNKAKLRTDAFILELSDRNPAKISEADKKKIVKDKNVQSRKERED